MLRKEPSAKTRRRAFYLVAGFAAVVALAVWMTSALASSQPSPKGVAAPVPGSAVAELSKQAASSFSVFAGPVGSAEDVNLVEQMVRGEQSVALDPGSVRLARTSSGIQVRVAGDSESVCLVGRIPGKAIWGGCAPNASAISPSAPEIAATGSPPGEVSRPGGKLAVDALFPNGTTAVEIVNPDGETTPLSVVNNTVAFIAKDDTMLSWTGPEGHSYSASLPH